MRVPELVTCVALHPAHAFVAVGIVSESVLMPEHELPTSTWNATDPLLFVTDGDVQATGTVGAVPEITTIPLR